MSARPTIVQLCAACTALGLSPTLPPRPEGMDAEEWGRSHLARILLTATIAAALPEGSDSVSFVLGVLHKDATGEFQFAAQVQGPQPEDALEETARAVGQMMGDG